MARARFDDNRAAWVLDLPAYEPLPALRGTAHADVAIIGGGLTGVSAAWHLSARFPGRRIALVEARALANGASGRNGGQVLNGINGVEPQTPETLRQLYAATQRGIATVEALAAAAELPSGFTRCGCLEVYTSPRRADAAAQRAARWTSWGVALQWRARETVALHGVHGGVLDPSAAVVNSAALVRGLRPALLARGVAMYENTPVARVDDGPVLTLQTPHGALRAPALVLATNAYTPQLGFFRRGIVPLHAHMVATEPLSAAQWTALDWRGFGGFSDDRARIAYGCRTPSGRLAFGGGSNAAYTYRFGGAAALRGGAAVRRSRAPARRLRDYMPALAGAPIAQRWSGPLAITFDRVCSMGVGGPHRNVYYALGYSGHGLALAALAGEVLTDLYAGQPDPWRALPFYQRPLPYIPPEPARWTGYHLYTRLTGRSPRR